MTATDELRRLLDERGVEWGAEESELDHVTTWNANGGQAMFYESKTTNPNLLQVNYYDLTPAQAVEATLGRGTCNADETDTWECVRDDLGGYGKTLTVHVMECTECGHTYEHVNGSYEFCPRCGRKVVDA